MAYSPGNPPATGQPNLERYLADELNRIRQQFDLSAQVALSVLVAIGYGGVIRPSASNIGAITAIYETIEFSAAGVAVPVSVDQDFANNGLRINRAGVWLFNFQTSIQHDDVNSGRNMNFRLRNLDDAATISSWKAGTGRNTEWTRIAVPVLFDVPESLLGKLLVMQVNAGIGTYLGAASWDSTMSVNHVSELQALPI